MGFRRNVQIRMQVSVIETNNVNFQVISALENCNVTSVNRIRLAVSFGIERTAEYAVWDSEQMYNMRQKLCHYTFVYNFDKC